MELLPTRMKMSSQALMEWKLGSTDVSALIRARTRAMYWRALVKVLAIVSKSSKFNHRKLLPNRIIKPLRQMNRTMPPNKMQRKLSNLLWSNRKIKSISLRHKLKAQVQVVTTMQAAHTRTTWKSSTSRQTIRIKKPSTGMCSLNFFTALTCHYPIYQSLHQST